MPCQLAHFLGHTSQDVAIPLAGTAAVFLYLVVDEEVVEVAGEVEEVLVEGQFHAEIKGVLGGEIRLEHVDAALELVVA